MLFLLYLCIGLMFLSTHHIFSQAYRPFALLILNRSFCTPGLCKCPYHSILVHWRLLATSHCFALFACLCLCFHDLLDAGPRKFFLRSADGDLSLTTHVCSAPRPSYHNCLDCSSYDSAENRPSSILEMEKGSMWVGWSREYVKLMVLTRRVLRD